MTDSWDAKTYSSVSRVQLAWGHKVIRSKKWTGRELVMDAGAGEGALAKVLAMKLPGGWIYAVDSDSNMVEQARKNLANFDNVKVIHADVESVDLPERVDVIFSNAALHWMLDHEKVFLNFWNLLRPGGELLIQCGGYGNLTDAISIIEDKIVVTHHFKRYFADWKAPWYFAKPEDTSKLLEKIGFIDISVYLSREPTAFSSREEFSKYVKTVVLWPLLACLPTPGLKTRFLRAFLDEYGKWSKSGWSLDYVRLNITAKKSGESRAGQKYLKSNAGRYPVLQEIRFNRPTGLASIRDH